MTMETDLYRYNNNLYYATPDPLDVDYTYVMRIGPTRRPISYDNMRLYSTKCPFLVAFKLGSTPCHIGWIPVSCDVYKEYPELLI